MSWEWKLIQEQCVGCGICVDVCLYAAIRMTREIAYPEAAEVRCEGCMLCKLECPTWAIEVSGGLAASARPGHAESG